MTRFSLLLLVTALGACASNSVTDDRADVALKAQVEPGAPNSVFDLAQRLSAEGDHQAAIPLYRQALTNNAGGNDPIYQGLGRSLMAVGQYGEAEAYLRRAVAGRPQDPEPQRLLGSLYLTRGEPAEALIHLDKAIALGATAKAWSSRAVALDLLGRHDAAKSAHERAVALDRDSLEARTNRALSQALVDAPETAVADLEDIALDPRATARHRQNLALAYQMADRPQDALRAASIDLDPETAVESLEFYETLKGLPPTDRLASLVYASATPAVDRSEPANLVLGEGGEQERAAVARVVGVKPAPEPDPAPEPEPEPEPLSIPPLLEPEGWAVQIGAYRSIEKLVEGWKILSRKYAGIIGGLPPRRSEVDFGERERKPNGFYYRLNAGPLKGFAQADAICKQLKAKGAPCWIRPPEPSEGRLPSAAEDRAPKDAPSRTAPVQKAEDTRAPAKAI